MCHLLCDSLETYHASFDPHAQELFGDIRNFTDQTPVVQISEVIVENSWFGKLLHVAKLSHVLRSQR
jgi:hypothetical protein